MGQGGRDMSVDPPDILERESLCFSQPVPGLVLHRGEEGFRQELARLYAVAENNAAEKLVKLKDRLRRASTEDFWVMAMEGIADLLDSQYVFISKRIVVDDENLAVEMPPIGEPGSCLMGAAFYYNDERGHTDTFRDIRYHAYGCPCAYMKHDKVFLIPERLNEFITDNPNEANLIIPGEAYLGIPLFAEGKCFAHFGVMWSAAGVARRKLSWAYLEMLLHSLEDMILERVLEGKSFAKPTEPIRKRSRVVPHEAITAAQSLKPYARSLSHELRTPMQGVVGMLDVMYATVQEAAEGQKDARARRVFETLKENIEVVQDSSRRAVEAADNVVHAYDMNMGVPDTPHSPLDDESCDACADKPKSEDVRPDIVVTGNDIPMNFGGNKRRRNSIAWPSGNEAKVPSTDTTRTARSRPPVQSKDSGVEILDLPYEDTEPYSDMEGVTPRPSTPQSISNPLPSPPIPLERHLVPGLRHTHLRDVLQYIVNDSLKVGGRPESAIAQETESGERIEVRIRSSNGEEKVKMVEWSVDPGIPETMLIDEKDLAKMISCVFLNAVKFTEEGLITVTAKLSPKSRYIVINVRDTGPGIPPAFLPNLFKPFSREDDSLTRQSEGLGLGLLVAKGLSRKLGGDLFCIRADTSGSDRGSEFEMRVPLTPGEVCSRPGSPFGSSSPAIIPSWTDPTAPPPIDHPHTQPPFPTSPSMPDAIRGILRRENSRRSHSPAATSHPPPPSALPIPIPLLHHAPLRPVSPPGSALSRRNSATPATTTSSSSKKPATATFDRDLASKHPLTFLVAEDNRINRKLLVSMLHKLGYHGPGVVHEAYDGAEAVRVMERLRERGEGVDVVLMDLWMPGMDGYEAAERILGMAGEGGGSGGVSGSGGSGAGAGDTKRRMRTPTILAVTVDVTDGALKRAAKAGMKGFMTKPYKLLDLERLIVEYCARQGAEEAVAVAAGAAARAGGAVAFGARDTQT